MTAIETLKQGAAAASRPPRRKRGQALRHLFKRAKAGLAETLADIKPSYAWIFISYQLAQRRFSSSDKYQDQFLRMHHFFCHPDVIKLMEEQELTLLPAFDKACGFHIVLKGEARAGQRVKHRSPNTMNVHFDDLRHDPRIVPVGNNYSIGCLVRVSEFDRDDDGYLAEFSSRNDWVFKSYNGCEARNIYEIIPRLEKLVSGENRPPHRRRDGPRDGLEPVR